jgi:hypothetical protein
MTAPSAISWNSIRNKVLDDPAVKAEYDALGDFRERRYQIKQGG